MCRKAQLMQQAIHESKAFNSRNREVAIHCVFSVKDNTHYYLLPALLRRLKILSFITSFHRDYPLQKGRNYPRSRSRKRRFIRILCCLLSGGNSTSLISSSILHILEYKASDNARSKSSRSSFIFSISWFVVLL